MGHIYKVLPHRLYEILLDDRLTRQRILRRVIFSREPPNVVQDDTDPVPR
jgi:hypothetical protein